MRIRVGQNTRMCFGTVLWGGAEVEIPVLAGAVVTAERVELRDDTPAPVAVSSPAYVEGADGTLTAYRLRDEAPLEMRDLDSPGSRQAFAAFVGGMGVDDVVLPTP